MDLQKAYNKDDKEDLWISEKLWCGRVIIGGK